MTSHNLQGGQFFFLFFFFFLLHYKSGISLDFLLEVVLSENTE